MVELESVTAESLFRKVVAVVYAAVKFSRCLSFSWFAYWKATPRVCEPSL